ncbi:MAG: S-layer homology domain-containing protein, partial [Clostridia bacterium]|nr:S-layer homology domain-containing protein [Clostridia bacterium]
AGINNPMFYVEFEILDTSAPRAFVNIERAVITDVNMSTSTNNDLSTIAGVINISAEISGGETDGDDGTGDDSTGSGDNSGGDDEGTTGDNTDTDDADKDDSTTGDNSGSDSDDDEGSTGGTNSSGSPIKPSTGNNNNTGSGSSPSSKPSSNTSTSTGSATGGVTGGVTAGTAAAPEKKASDIFSDVSDSHWAAASVVRLNQLGIVAGDDQGRANLDNKITRAETSKLALLVNGITVKTGLTLDVTDSADVPEWARDYMATAVAEGIFKGYQDGSIKPVNNITRAEMVSVIISSLGISTDDNAQASFADMGSDHWAAKLVAKAVELGFVNGYEDNTFKPGNPITRAEAFAIFARVADYLKK